MASSMASALMLLAFVVLSLNPTDAQNIGVCYGMNGDNLPSAQDTVNLYKTNGITKMRLYSPDHNALQALQGSGIGIILDVPTNGNDLQSLGSSADAATQWVQTNVVPYASVIRYIAVGNEVMPGDSNAQYILPAMQNVQNALGAASLAGQIKVSTAVKSSLLSNTFPPSNSDFGSSSSYFNPIVNFLNSNGSPLLTNIYPYFSYIGDRQDISLDYALFTASGTVVTDSGNGLQYQNLFDALVDSFYAALEKAGGSGVGIVVSESGWPSQGTDVATSDNAGTYYTKLIGHVGSGTPKKQGQALETYLFAMYDEDNKGGDEVERHFGLFTPSQQNKYGIGSFSG
ncbi:hypothetical protein V2J09_018516 [Rumex salicifolius]